MLTIYTCIWDGSQVVLEPLEQRSWIVCDGDVDPEWIGGWYDLAHTTWCLESFTSFAATASIYQAFHAAPLSILADSTTALPKHRVPEVRAACSASSLTLPLPLPLPSHATQSP